MAVTRARRRTMSSNCTVSDSEAEPAGSPATKSKRNKRSSDSLTGPLEAAVSAVSAVYHREETVDEMTGVLTCRAPFLFITGPPNSGKTYCIEHVVSTLQDALNIVSVDMRDVLKVQCFYHTVLSQLSCDTIPDHTSDFVRLLRTQLAKPCVLVVKHAQLLNELNSLLFASVTILYQLTEGMISVVMVCDTPWELVYTNNGSTLSPPIILSIPPYTRLQMVDIIAQYLLEKHCDTCSELGVGLVDLANYVRTCVYDSMSHYTSSLREMMSTASTLLNKYLQPVRDKELKITDNIKLYHKIQPDLVNTMSQLSCIPSFKTSLSLPYNMRVLLVCGFLASHNPARLDKRFFCKGKSSRRKVKSRGGSKVSEALKGPKTFPLDRLLAIHCSLTQDGTIPCSDILIAISSLVSLNLMVRVSVDLLEQPKYKCLAPMATVQSLAKESGIDFERFYYNY